MLSKAKFARLTDGMAVFYKDGEGRSAKGVDPSTAAGLEAVCKMAFADAYLRQQDVEMAEQDGSHVTRKIRVLQNKALDATMTVGIGPAVFDVTKIDQASDRTAYVYLDEIESDGTVELDGDTVHCRARSWSQSLDSSASAVSLRPSVSVTIRAVDWSGQTKLVRDGKRYTVTYAISKGDWVTLKAEQKAGDR